MGYLDDIKRQAEALKAKDGDGRRLVERTVQVVEAAAREVNAYLMDLTTNLDVIRPPSRCSYVLDKGIAVERLPMTDFRFDARRAVVHDIEVIDHVFMGCTVASRAQHHVSKNFLNGMQALEARLNQASAPFEREPIRRDDGKLAEMRYTFTADVQVSVFVQCDHDRGCLHFTLRNLDALETVECDFPPHAITRSRLDELARWWVGEPNRFLAGAVELRRIEAR